MRKFNFIIIMFIAFNNYSQTITSKNFKAELAGKWTLNLCDANWNIIDWICVDTLIFSNTGFVNSVRTCQRPQGYPEDEEYEGVFLSQEEWTRFNMNKMILYCKTFEEWDNKWSEESQRYRVISITKNEIKAEFDGWTEENNSKQVNYIIYRRVD